MQKNAHVEYYVLNMCYYVVYYSFSFPALSVTLMFLHFYSIDALALLYLLMGMFLSSFPTSGHGLLVTPGKLKKQLPRLSAPYLLIFNSIHKMPICQISFIRYSTNDLGTVAIRPENEFIKKVYGEFQIIKT